MADNTTELEVLNQIVDVLGGQGGQYETVVPVLEDIRDLLGGGGGGGGYNPALSVGRADALTGADDTAQWATRESTGSGAATVRSVQGAAEVIDGELVPVQIAGIRSTDAQGGELDAIEWPTQTLRAAGSARDELTADELVTRVGVVTLDGSETWKTGGAAYDGTNGTDRFTALANGLHFTDTALRTNITAVGFNAVTNTWANPDNNVGNCALYYADNALNAHFVFDNATVGITSDMTADERTSAIRAWLAQHPIEAYYPIVPTTTPISPTLPMTYRVEQGGSESIIVPDGEISAAPVLTVAEGESAADVVMDALACIAASDGPVATSNHAVGTYLTMGGKLYKVTSAIAVGETIKSGTNVSQTTVMAELIARTA